jgi:small subunit ribosomal protein S1
VEDVVKEGQAVEVWVKRVRKDRIELTMIEPLAFEWKEIQPDLIVKGRVVRLETYGAFVDFGAERPGLIHVSELTHGYVKTPVKSSRKAKRSKRRFSMWTAASGRSA